MVTATIAVARKKVRMVRVPLEGEQGFFASPAWESMFGVSRFCCLERGRLQALPSVSFLPGLFGRKSDSSLSDQLAEVQGLVCPEGYRGSRGHFHSREDFQRRQLSGQGGALY